jgi:hypothetical protein
MTILYSGIVVFDPQPLSHKVEDARPGVGFGALQLA